MYFGEFLISKKIITEEQLLDALIIQVENLPSFLRILREDKTISSQDIVKFIKMQLENNSDLITVLKSEGRIDEKKLQNLFQKQVANRKILGSVLVELKYVEQSVIEKMLHEFLREKENINLVKPKIAEVEISQAALESLRELGLSDEDFAPVSSKIINEPKMAVANIFHDEFLNTFNEKMHNKLIKLSQMLLQAAKDESDISNYFNSLYRELFILKGAALLAELKLSVNILNAWAEMIEKKLQLNNNQLKEWGIISLPILSESIDCLWEIRELLLSGKSEEGVQDTPSLHDKYLKNISVMKTIV